MSTRYAVVLIPEPSFTARVYRARQLICGQYATWAAEMHLLHLALTDYLPFTEAAVGSVSAGLEAVADGIRQTAGKVALTHTGVTIARGLPGHIFLDFNPESPTDTGESDGLKNLRVAALGALESALGPAWESPAAGEDFPAHIYLMQHASLPPGVLAGAVEFAQAVCEDLKIPGSSRAWQLMLVRFQSEAAGDDWSGGRWAADLSWNIVSAHNL